MKSHAYARICFCASTTQVTRTSHLRLCLQAKRIRCDTQQPQIWLSDVPLSIRFNERTSFEKLPTTVRTIPTEMFRFRPYDQLVELANTGKQLPDKMGELSAIRSTITDRIPKAQRVMLTLCLERDANFCVRLFDSLALAFHSKFDSYGREPRIILVTSVNPKIVAGRCTCSSTSGS
ncbi:uncharacterized protein LOC106370527 isoform X2 [Brassica napus]|uniref:uncharacterized protein LOC106310374 isoform X2 n=1 Tax=Brassica oleracea var. oleracea TaxID=109376 RepID=UPI0006A6E88F|nr:PREDICTED: uncharacterized protein LOC106310374 isoform X2 [Brassica oleracea var. oleracea]XP_048621445.1 uncharacterized protein LOC106370527 isoform X2 [Brassica napus]